MSDQKEPTKHESSEWENEIFLNSIIENIPLMIFVKEAVDLRFVKWNKAGEKLVGFTNDQLLGKNDFDFFSREQAAFFTDKDREVLENGKLVDIPEEPIDTPAGIRTLHTRKIPILDENGTPKFLLGISEDITDRKRDAEANSRLREIMEASQDLIGICTSDGKIAYLNPTGRKLLGLTDAQDLSDRSFRSFYPPWAIKKITDEAIPTALKNSQWRGELAVLTSAGTELPVTQVINVHRDPKGKLAYVSSIIRDNTEISKLNAQIAQAQKMESIGQLAGGIAHDFNNFLSVIMGYGELVTNALAKLPDMDLVLADVKEIKVAADRAATLTRQLLAFSRRQVLQPQIMDLNEAVSGMEKMLRRLIGEDISLSVVQEADPRMIKADPGQVEQVILNLVLNSRDAMPNGGKLALEIKNHEVMDPDSTIPPPGSFVRLTATDTGTGMTEAVKARIFEPFFTTKAKGKGTGLGLSMVYGVVKQSGAFISVESEPGKGATFSIFFPVAEEPSFAQSEPDAIRLGNEGGSETILLVEDDKAIREMMTRFLRKKKYTVLPAANGAEALNLSRGDNSPIHLMITDIVMPGMNGVDLAQVLTAERKDTRVLFISGYTDHAIFKNEVPALSSKFLAKPFTPTDLMVKVREILSRPLS